MSNVRWGIDANLILQQAIGRLVSACVESTGGELLVPERALNLAETRYFTPAQRRARRVIEWELDPTQYTPAELRELQIACSLAIHGAFGNWAGEETQRNDGIWTVAPDTEAARTITASLLAASIAQPSGQPNPVEEDARVAGEALAAGCRWIASRNLGMLSDDLNAWLAHEQAYHRLPHASLPFICSADTAVADMTERNEDRLAALAWEVTRPNDNARARNFDQRLKTAMRFVRALHRGGATGTAEHLAAIFHRRTDPQQLEHRLVSWGYRGTLERTRTGYDRLATATRRAQREALDAALPDQSASRPTGARRS